MHDDYWNQWPGVILGAEDDDDGSDPNEGNDSDSDDEDDDSNEGDQGNEGNQPSADDVAALQRALQAERRNNKRLTRENNRFKASQDRQNNDEANELEETRTKLQESTSRTEKLAAGLLSRDLNKAIEDEAKKQNFIDPSDAINGVDRLKLVYDQDDEDPTDIDIDLASVVAEVKRLAASKPHFISRGTDDGEPSGSGFGGSKKQKKNSEDQMRELYPSL